MKILITGASGFIGDFLVERALEQNRRQLLSARSTDNASVMRDNTSIRKFSN